jgi:hypothetical protein
MCHALIEEFTLVQELHDADQVARVEFHNQFCMVMKLVHC